MVCEQGGLYGLHRGGIILGGLGLKGQPDGSSERNILEYSCTEDGNGAGKAIFEGGLKFEASDTRN